MNEKLCHWSRNSISASTPLLVTLPILLKGGTPPNVAGNALFLEMIPDRLSKNKSALNLSLFRNVASIPTLYFILCSANISGLATVLWVTPCTDDMDDEPIP